MILDEIVAYKEQEVALMKKEKPIENIMPRKNNGAFRKALARPGINLIAEVKKASPSKGLLRADFQPEALAKAYQQAGAAAISVLTDRKFFQGSLENLQIVRKAVDIPLLRKEFIIDEYQIYEASLAGADAVLLIAGILSTETLKRFIELADQMGMDALVEVHCQEELGKALEAGASIIGINNRDLTTFHVSLNTTLELAPQIPDQCLVVSESGIHRNEDVKMLEQAGINAILVGEALVVANDPAEKIKELLGTGRL